MSDRIIAVTGATGYIGSRVARQLAAKGSRQLLVVRDPSRAPKLDNAQIRQASGYINGNEMRAAFEGSHTVFLISGSESAIRVAEHITAVNAAVAAGVERIVYLSYFDAAEDSIFTFARDHHATEQHIRTTGIPFTFLRMNMFMDFVPSMVSVDGVISGPAGDGRPRRVDVRPHRPRGVLARRRCGAHVTRLWNADHLSQRDRRRSLRVSRRLQRAGLGGRRLGHDLHGHRRGATRAGERRCTSSHRP
jgi:uncharacterized protein YbjT (DUF2867 family)